MHTCIVICAGDFVPMDIDRKDGDLCIAVDGGYRYCRMLGLEPDLIVGDMDSLEEGLKAELAAKREEHPEKLVLLNPEKDDTDTLAALRIGIGRGYRSFRIYGAMGGKLEHTIANIQCLSYLVNQGAKAYIMDTDMMMTVIQNETIAFRRGTEGCLSLFALGERAKGVTIKGMKYPLDKALVTNDYPIGISNEFTGDEGRITVENGMLLLMIRRRL